jgi:transglutaminase-like putative cysteine protease
LKLDVAWSTTYAYSEPVRVLHTELRVVPAQRFGQQVAGWRLDVTPNAAIHALDDAFGNTVHHFDNLGSVQRIRVEMEAHVETAGGTVEHAELSPLERHLALTATVRCPHSRTIREFAPARGTLRPLDYAAELQRAMAAAFVFETGHTDVDDTAEELMTSGHGVCQDFAHFMLASLRMQGVPARYVSGYLETGHGAEATHAWVQAWDGGAWHGLDPANNCPQDERYVVIGVGRDYDDVPPIRGSFRGSAEEEWNAVVGVQSREAQSQ